MTWKKNVFACCFMAACMMLFLVACKDPSGSTKTQDSGLTNDLFAITLPDELAGMYETDIGDDYISVFHKASKEADYGGFVFEISAKEDPSYFESGLSAKVGELTAKDGTIYDIALTYPSDVQYDYTSEEAEKSYAKLYASAEAAARTLVGVNGAVYAYGAGMKGEELYEGILQKYVEAVKEGWDPERLEEEDMSHVYYFLRGEGDEERRAGYCFYDVNGDGVEELLIGEIAQGGWKGVIYDIYTMVDRAPAHVVSGWERNRYYVANSHFIINEGSSSAFESFSVVYDLMPNSTELCPQMGFKFDAYENEAQPWFISYDVEGDVWENVDEATWQEHKERFEIKRLDYAPLS